MRILDKYILRELLGPFIFGIAAFSSIFIGTSTLFKIAQYITEYGASILSVTKMFLYSLPGIIVLTFPMSMLLSALLSFGKLSASSELTAMRAGGISFFRLAMPVFITALIVSLFAVFFNEFVVPQANNAYRNVVRYEIQNAKQPAGQEHVVIKDVKDGSIKSLVYARKFNAETNEMEVITVQEFEKERLVRVHNAEKALWTNTGWVMYNGVIHDLTAEGQIQRTMKFKQQVMPVNKDPKDITREQKRLDEMTIRELKEQIDVLESEYAPTAKHKVEMYQRITIPMASFVFALIGTPLGLQPHRSSSAIGFGLSVIIIFIYYGIMTVTTALGQGGVIPPLIAAWIPNLIGIVAGLALIYRASK